MIKASLSFNTVLRDIYINTHPLFPLERKEKKQQASYSLAQSRPKVLLLLLLNGWWDSRRPLPNYILNSLIPVLQHSLLGTHPTTLIYLYAVGAHKVDCIFFPFFFFTLYVLSLLYYSFMYPFPFGLIVKCIHTHTYTATHRMSFHLNGASIFM